MDAIVDRGTQPPHTLMRRPMGRITGPTLALVGLAALALASAASSSTLRANVSQDTLTLGDRVQFTVALTVPRGVVVQPPETESGFGDFAVKEWTSEKAERTPNDSLTFHYVITTYTMKACSIPELRFVVIAGDQQDTLVTPVKMMKVLSVITGDSVDIKDLKPQQRAGKPSLAWIWIIAALIGAIVLFVMGQRLIRRLRKPPPPPPPKPPYDEAIEALNRLEAMNYVKLGQIRDYVFGLSEILKRYIERRYEVHAAEFTTEEMLDWVRASMLLKADKQRVDWFFRNSDPVKFAKYIPEDEILARMAEEVRGFLDATRPAMVGQNDQIANSKSQTSSNPQQEPNGKGSGGA